MQPPEDASALGQSAQEAALPPSSVDQCGVAFPCPRGHDAPAWIDHVVDLSRGTPAGQRNQAIMMPTGARSSADTILFLSGDNATARADVQAWRDANAPGARIQMLPREDMAPSEQVMRLTKP